MKRLLTILLALTLVLSLNVAVFAAEYTDAATATFEVTYTATNGGTQPEETFTFSEFTCTSVTDAADGVTTANAPKPEKIADITLNSTTTSATATITLPTYTSVGVYTYTFHQNVGTKAGVVYYKADAQQDMSLVVTVVEQNGKVRVAAVHVEAGTTSSDKTGTIANTYESGTLAVSKSVTGNLGDKTKYFEVTVTFTPPTGETIASVITYSGGKYTEAVTVSGNTATFQVKDGDTITFLNLPKGTTWTVEEASYSADGYTTTYSAASGDIAAGDADTCTITNDKNVNVDTGISLDSLPYILLLVAVAAVVVVMIIRKRRTVED